MKLPTLFSLIFSFLICDINAFIPLTNKPASFASPAVAVPNPFQRQPSSFQQQQLPKQRQSVASITTFVFGLGAPEIAVILAVAAFVLGPAKLAELGKDAGKIAGELKEVPKEFQQGMAEGEKEALKMKKQIESEVKDVTATSDDK